jgi:hypothetical protein
MDQVKIPTTQEVIKCASNKLSELPGHIFDVLSLSKPPSPEAALNLSKIISKLSPLVGNLIEFNVVEFLNEQEEFDGCGEWQRQDPGFPDTIFAGDKVNPTPGFEIKAWFPLATEITARFKDSQNHFQQDQTYVTMLAWLPEKVIYGKPRIIDVVTVSGFSVAYARDTHYHNPPDYLVLEPEDTSARTANLQQTNTNGYKFQGTRKEFSKAQKIVAGWGADGTAYKPTSEYQTLLRELIEKFKYRLDTNFAKMDRIVHDGIETFKTQVYNTEYRSLKIGEWNKLLNSKNDNAIKFALQKFIGITEEEDKDQLKEPEDAD